MFALKHVVVAIAIGGMLSLTSCSSSVDAVIQSSGGSTSLSSSATHETGAGVTVAEAQAIMQSYDTANNAAIKASGRPTYDEKTWASADAGPALASDVFSTRLAEQQGDKSTPKTFTHTVMHAYGSTTRSSDGQPPWLLVTGIVPAVGNSGMPYDFASVLVKEPAGWRMWANLGGDLTSLPTAPRTVQQLTTPQRQAAANSISLLGRAVATGSVDEIGKGSEITEYRTALHEGLLDTEMTVEPRPWGTPEGTDTATATVVGTPAALLMRVGSTTLGLVSFENTVTYDGSDGDVIVEIDPDHAAVEGNDTLSTKAQRRTYQTMLVSIDDAGKTTIFSSTDGLLAKA